MSVLAAALSYYDRGWTVFPCRDKHTPAVKWKELQSSRPSREQTAALFAGEAEYIAVVLGQASNLLRLDADGGLAMQELERMGGVPATLSFSSPSGGRGYLLKYVEGITTWKFWRGEGEHEELRVQSDGAYTIVPPSPGYTWLDESELASIPAWLYERYVEKTLYDLAKQLRPTLRLPEKEEVVAALEHVDAEDYDMWVQVGMCLHTGGDEYLDVWKSWSATSDKYKDGECERKWNTFNRAPGGLTTRSILFWAERNGYRPPNRHEPLTDMGNARVLARMGDGRIKHSANWGWMAWDGKRWKLDDAEKVVVELQKAVLEHRYNAAMQSLTHHLQSNREADDFDKVKKRKIKTVLQVRQQETERSIRGARLLAESEPNVSVDYRQFDRRSMLLNCANGTLNLRTGELYEPDPEDKLTQLCPTPYVEDAECPRWEQFLVEVFDGDMSLVYWTHKLLGYCLTGNVSEHVLPIFHGVGRNGKSTLIKTVLSVLGSDYAGTTPSEFLVKTKGEQHPTKLVTLYGKRFVADLETGDGARLNEEIVKRLTGGDQIPARRMYEDFWTFDPTHKLILCTNYEPKVRGVDIAIWNRLKLVPFNVVFEGDRRDIHLDEKLANETVGILAWMVRGCKLWREEGLGEAEGVKVATANYRETQDTVTQFFAERCERLENSKIRKSDVVAAYKSWCTANGQDPLAPKAFGVAIAKLGVASDDTGKFYTGIRL